MSSPTDKDDVTRQRIEATVDKCNQLFFDALGLRLQPADAAATRARNVESFADQLIDLSNVSCDVEEKVALLSIMMQQLQTEWDYIAAPELARPRGDKYMDKLGRISAAMGQYPNTYTCLQRVVASVNVGRSAVGRLDVLAKAASRAAGLFLDP